MHMTLWLFNALVGSRLALGRETCQSDEAVFLQRVDARSDRRGDDYIDQVCQLQEQAWPSTCAKLSDANCKKPFAPPNITVQQTSGIAANVKNLANKVFAATIPYYYSIVSISHAITLFFPGSDGEGNNQEALNAMYAQTQSYVANQISVAMLQTLYNEILGFQLDMLAIDNKHNLWVNETDQALRHKYATDYKSTMASTIESFRRKLPTFSCSTPWHDGGTNGYGIFFAQFVTLYQTTLMQYISSFPGADSLSYQQEAVKLSNTAILQASAMFKNYINQRLSYISPMDPFMDSTTCGVWKATDKYPVYAADGTQTATCEWDLQAADGSGFWWGTACKSAITFACCASCPTSYWEGSFGNASTCLEDHTSQVLAPEISNWQSWLLDPARSWGETAQTICDNFTSPGDECSRLPATVANLPTPNFGPDLKNKVIAETKVQCVADYGTPVGGAVCCNQPGVVGGDAADKVCGETTPVCSGYVINNHFGVCVSNVMAPTTQPCTIPTV